MTIRLFRAKKSECFRLALLEGLRIYSIYIVLEILAGDWSTLRELLFTCIMLVFWVKLSRANAR